MISQISNAVNFSTGSPAETLPVVDVNPRKSAARVELPTQAVNQVEAEPDIAVVKHATEQINKFLKQFDRNLQFSVDQATGTNVVKVVDTQSNEVIRQMPSPEMLAIARALDKLQGLLIKEKA